MSEPNNNVRSVSIYYTAFSCTDVLPCVCGITAELLNAMSVRGKIFGLTSTSSGAFTTRRKGRRAANGASPMLTALSVQCTLYKFSTYIRSLDASWDHCWDVDTKEFTAETAGW